MLFGNGSTGLPHRWLRQAFPAHIPEAEIIDNTFKLDIDFFNDIGSRFPTASVLLIGVLAATDSV